MYYRLMIRHTQKYVCTIKAFVAVELDSADLNITRVTYHDFHNLFLKSLQLQSEQQVNELGFLCSNEKLTIQLPDTLKKGTSFSLRIEYSAIPRRGSRAGTRSQSFLQPETL